MSKNEGRPTLALHLIVRNEEKSIETCLSSVRGLVDEIVIGVDPDTSDHTWDVAERWLKEWDPAGAKWTLFQGKSVEKVGFAKARNAVLEKVKSDWVLAVDADEWLPERQMVSMPGADGRWQQVEFRSHDIIRAVVANAKPELDVIITRVVMMDDRDMVLTQFQGERLFRRHKRYTRAVHNVLKAPTIAATCEAAVFHSRKERSEVERAYRANQRLRMAEKFLLHKDLKKDPTDSRALFYLGGSYGESGRPKQAEEYYRRYLDSPNTWPQERYQAVVFLVRAVIERSRELPPKERLEALEEMRPLAARAIADNYSRAEVYTLLGQLAHEAGDFRQAVFFYKTATSCEFRVDPHFVETITHSWFPYLQLASAWFALGDSEKAQEAFLAAKERNAPDGALDQTMRYAYPYFRPPQRLGVVIDGSRQFIDPMMKEWATRMQVGVCTNREGLEQTLEWADTVWFEWADRMLIEATTKLSRRCRTIVRVHGYEVFAGNLTQVNWSRVDTVIFPNDWLKEIACVQVPALRAHCQLVVAHGGVQTKHFTISEGKTGNKVALAGYINHKKGIEHALEIFYEAQKLRPELELHLAGEVQDARCWLHLGTLIDELALREKVHIHPWQEDLNGWFADKDYILSTSTGETFHYVLAEGMAAGLKPIICCWRGARDLYPDEWVYRTTAEAVAMVMDRPTAEDRARYRSYIEVHYPFERLQKLTDLVLARKTVCVVAPSPDPLRPEESIAQACEELGFGQGPLDTADLVIYTEAAKEYLDMPKGKPSQKRFLWCLPEVKQSLDGVGAQFDAIVTTEEVFMGGARDLWRADTSVPRDIDVGFLGDPTDRQRAFIEKIGEALFAMNDKRNLVVETSTDMNVRRQFLMHCKVVLHVYSGEEKRLSPLALEAMAAGAVVVGEGVSIAADTPEGIASCCEALLNDDDMRRKTALGLCSQVWREKTMRQQTERALEAAGMRWA